MITTREQGPGLPAQFRLKDEACVEIRRLAIPDYAAVVLLSETLTEHERYLRFFTMHPGYLDEWARSLTEQRGPLRDRRFRGRRPDRYRQLRVDAHRWLRRNSGPRCPRPTRARRRHRTPTIAGTRGCSPWATLLRRRCAGRELPDAQSDFGYRLAPDTPSGQRGVPYRARSCKPGWC